jgi:TRAP-type C4-dicarboxylate transport system permease small subunit
MKILEYINKRIETAETVLLVLVMTVMVLLSFLQVVLRNVFDQGILWGDILLRHLVLWVGFLGASLATREEKHISIDLFTRFLRQRGQHIVRVITNLFASYICYLLASASISFVSDEKMYGTTLFGDVPAWYFQLIIPIGFILMGFRFLVLAIQYTVFAVKRETKDS